MIYSFNVSKDSNFYKVMYFLASFFSRSYDVPLFVSEKRKRNGAGQRFLSRGSIQKSTKSVSFRASSMVAYYVSEKTTMRRRKAENIVFCISLIKVSRRICSILDMPKTRHSRLLAPKDRMIIMNGFSKRFLNTICFVLVNFRRLLPPWP